QAEIARRRRTGREGGVADLDGLHEGLNRQSPRQEHPAGIQGARHHRLHRRHPWAWCDAATRNPGPDPRTVHSRHPPGSGGDLQPLARVNRSSAMKYVALLRGINVGGANVIKMAALKSCLERLGFASVTTLIASGNVVFESSERKAPKLRHQIETALSNTF